MPRVVIRPAADRDLDEQAEYLARHSREAAERFYEAAASTFAFLAGSPGLGSPWKSKRAVLARMRVWRVQGFEKHVVFYRPIRGGIEVLRVLHGARNLEEIMGE